MSDEPVSIDAELQSLLSDLEHDTEPTPEDTTGDVLAATTLDNAIVIPDPEMSDSVVDMEQVELPDLPLESSPTNNSDLAAIVDKFDKDYGEVQANLKRDRGRIDNVIDILLKRVKDNADAETDTMSLVKALAVLADTNGHAVKLLDSRSKLLSATKSTINAQQTNVNITGTDVELQNILKQPAEVEI
jgi:hypothetical protein